MGILVNILLWLHLVALAVGGAASFGIPVVGSRMPSASPELRPTLMGISKGLGSVGRVGLVILLITGPLMIWLKYGGFGAVSVWFWVKMLLVLVLLGGVIYSGLLLKRVMGGDTTAAPMLPRVGMINTAVLLGIILSAVFAFNPV